MNIGSGDGPVLSGKITNLAGLRQRFLARRGITTNIRVEMAERIGAGAVLWNRTEVDVVLCKTEKQRC